MLRVFLQISRFIDVARLSQPIYHQTRNVIPQRVDFDGLAPTGRDYPTIHFRIHPSELITFRALSEQSIVGVHTDPEISTTNMRVNDLF